MSSRVFVAAFTLLIAALATAAHLIGAPTLVVAVGVLLLIALGVLAGAARYRRPDPPAPDHTISPD